MSDGGIRRSRQGLPLAAHQRDTGARIQPFIEEDTGHFVRYSRGAATEARGGVGSIRDSLRLAFKGRDRGKNETGSI